MVGLLTIEAKGSALGRVH